MTQQQLFANYELDNSRWFAIILKFLGGSLALHLILFLSAVYIPAVRDAFYVAALFSDAADKRFVNRDYTLMDIDEEATVITLPKSDRFRYPEGYFNSGEYIETQMDPTVLALNDPTLSGQTTLPPLVDTTTPAPTFSNPTITTPPVTTFPSVNMPPLPRVKSRRNTLPPLPKPPRGAKMDSLTPGIDDAAPVNGETAKNNNKDAQPKPSPGKDEQAQLDENEINRKPLYDFGTKVQDLQKNGKIDLNQPFAVTVEGELNKGGQLTKATVTKREGDQQLTDLSTELVKVLNASGVLKYISDVTLKDSPRQTHKIKFDVVQDPNNVNVNVVLEFDNAEIAYRIQSGANSAIGLTKLMRKDKIEGQLLQNVIAETDGKLVRFKTVMPRQAAEKLIQDQLAAAVQKPEPTKQ